MRLWTSNLTQTSKRAYEICNFSFRFRFSLILKWKTKALKKPFCEKSNTFTSTKIATRDLLRHTKNKLPVRKLKSR